MMLLSMATAGALSFAISVFVARWLGKDEFGVYSIVISVQAVVFLLASFSMGTAIAKHVSEYRSRDEAKAMSFAKSGLVFVLILAAGVGVVYALLAHVIGSTLYDEPTMVDIIPYSALVVFSLSLFTTSLGVVQGCQRFGLMVVMQVSSPLLSLVAILVLLPAMGVQGVFIGFFSAQVLVSVVCLAALNRTGFRFLSAGLDLGRESHVVSKLGSFALPAVLGSVMVTPVFWLGNTELTLSTGFEAMGLFAVAFVFFQSLMVIPNAIAVPMMPRVSELSVEKKEEIERLVRKMMRTLSIGLFPLLFAGALLSEFLVETLYGASYSAASEAVYLMVATVYFYSLGSVIGTIIVGLGKMWLGFALNILWAVMFLVAVVLAVPMEGVNGLAISYAASYGLFLIPVLWASQTRLKIKVTGMYIPCLSAIVLLVVGFVVQSEDVSYSLLAKAILFIAGALYFYAIGRDVFDSMYARLRNALHGSAAHKT